MSKGNIIRVVPRQRAWVVIVDPLYERMVDRLCTKERAIEHALTLAEELAARQRAPVTVRIEQADGRYEDRRAA